MSGNELPKVIDKSQADVDAAIAAINSCNLPAGTKDFAISCIKLAVWLPKALLEQRIRLSNLRKLIFGRGKKNNENSKPSKEHTSSTEEPKQPANDAALLAVEPIKSDTPATTQNASLPGHGRLPHSAYTNMIEHTLTISDLRNGDLCPEYCGGKLYRYEPGILVRIKGQNPESCMHIIKQIADVYDHDEKKSNGQGSKTHLSQKAQRTNHGST